jgi:hypothetical protein
MSEAGRLTPDDDDGDESLVARDPIGAWRDYVQSFPIRRRLRLRSVRRLHAATRLPPPGVSPPAAQEVRRKLKRKVRGKSQGRQRKAPPSPPPYFPAPRSVPPPLAPPIPCFGPHPLPLQFDDRTCCVRSRPMPHLTGAKEVQNRPGAPLIREQAPYREAVLHPPYLCSNPQPQGVLLQLLTRAVLEQLY